jgi:hypothetical protein
MYIIILFIIHIIYFSNNYCNCTAELYSYHGWLIPQARCCKLYVLFRFIVGNSNRFRLTCLGILLDGTKSQLFYLVFKSFDIERTRWRLCQTLVGWTIIRYQWLHTQLFLLLLSRKWMHRVVIVLFIPVLPLHN